MLSQQIKAFIDESGIKYSAIADKIKMPVTTFSAMINGKRKITADEYIAICKALRVSLDTFAQEGETNGN